MPGQRVFILGLDGMPFSFIKKIVSLGIMPATESILKQGNLLQIDASIPDVSAVSWSSFTTGKSPAEHSIFGFVDIDPKTYKIIFPGFADNKCKTFWEYESEKGKKCIVLNIPGTYPARPFNGIIISGFPAVNMQKAVHPSSLIDWLLKIDYSFDVDPPKSKEEFNQFLLNLIDSMGMRMDVMRKFNRDNKWDIFFVCLTEIDRFHHFFIDKSINILANGNDQIIKFYQQLDEYISEMYSWMSGNDVFIMVSDHGFTKINKEFYINSWLKEQGFQDNLYLENGILQGLKPSTMAFALDPCRIYIHQKNKFAEGGIDEQNYNFVVEDLISKLKDIEFNNNKVMKRVFRKEDIYQEGAYINKAADIICIPEDGFDIKGFFNKAQVFGESIFSGMHTQHDALFFINNLNFVADNKLNIQELSSLIF